jgi:hypothetical protein
VWTQVDGSDFIEAGQDIVSLTPILEWIDGHSRAGYVGQTPERIVLTATDHGEHPWINRLDTMRDVGVENRMVASSTQQPPVPGHSCGTCPI